MVFTTQCPKCGKILWFSNKLAGTLTICPACGGTMRLEPPPPAETQLSQAETQLPPAETQLPQPETPLTLTCDAGAFAPLDDTGQLPAQDSPPAAQSYPQIGAFAAVQPVAQEFESSAPQGTQQSSQQFNEQSAGQSAGQSPEHSSGRSFGDPSPPLFPPGVAPVAPPAQSLPPGSPAAALEGIYVEVPQDADDRVPAVVEQSFLTHQAAAAVGEVHVDVDQSDLVQWTQQQPAQAQQSVAPPVWAPAPLSGFSSPQAGQPQEAHWFPPPAFGSRGLSSLISRGGGRGDDGAKQAQILPWAIAVVAALLIILGLLALLPHGQSAGPWEESHRKEILDLKQSAEQLAMSGKYHDAYDKYEELERLVAGQQIEDAYLKGELEKSWRRRDEIFDRAMSGTPAPTPQQTANPPPAQTHPAPQSGAPASGNGPQSGGPLPSLIPPVAVNEIPPANAQSRPSPLRPVIAAATNPATAPAVVAQSPPPVIPPRPPVRPSARKAGGLTDAQIGATITKGANFLVDQFDGPTLAEHNQYHDGLDALAVYALMQSGLATHDKRLDDHAQFMIDAIEAMKKLPMTRDYVTYSRALRATALALYNRPEDRNAIRQDVDWLLKAQFDGAFTYSDQFARDHEYAFWDNSNSQYGLLGVWSGAEVGIPVPLQFWRDVQTHWTRDQNADGQWHYRAFDTLPRKSMTLAGIASLFVTQDYLDTEDFGDRVGRPPFTPALARGLEWLESGDNSRVAISDQYDFYTLYGLERAGLASGFKFFGQHDWYREHAGDLVSQIHPEGSFGGADSLDSIVDTSYSLLFLARGRHPLIMNKLRFDGNWANRPRDAANLAHFASADLERPLNWQVVPLDHDWHDWTDSPILYLASDKPPLISDADADKIRNYILNGGMLLTQADGGSNEFNAFAEALGKRLFPQYSWTDMPADHPLLSTSYKISNPPRTRIITNGSRILMMNWPTDVTSHWQVRQQRANRPSFELGVDLLLYAAGKSELKNRLQTDYVPASDTPPAAAIRVGRLSYDGNWDPEPAAWPRADRWFREATGLDLMLEQTPLESLPAANPPIAHLTGTARLNATPARIAAIQKYVQGGGVLVIDPCGIPGEFYRSVREDLLARAFLDATLSVMDSSHPMLAANNDGMTDVSTPAVREFVRSLPGAGNTHPMILKSGKGHVILLPLDLTSGLLGAGEWGIAGYQPDYALALMKNIVLWTWDGQKETP